MPKIIIGNVDNEHMVGNWERECAVTSFRQASSTVANRMAWLVEAGDILILPAPCSEEFISYILRLKGVDRGTVQIISASSDEHDPRLLTFQTLSDPALIDCIRTAMVGETDWELLPYYFDRTIDWLASALKVSLGELDSAFLRQGGAESFNSKKEFRRLAKAFGVPIANGQVCSSVQHLSKVVNDLLDETGTVILKQDFNAGGDGNSVITRLPELQEASGAGHVYLAQDSAAVKLASDEVWRRHTGGRNTDLIAEVFHRSDDIYFSDYSIPRLGSMPKYLTHGEMRMEPLWVGFRIPGPLPVGRTAQLMSGSALLAKMAADLGYVGMINFDAVFDSCGRPVFLEYNGRCGGTTHIHALAESMLGADYMDRFHLITRNKVPSIPFSSAYTLLDQAGLLFEKQRREGLFIMTDDTARKGTIEYLIVASSPSRATQLEQQVLPLIRPKKAEK